MHPGNKFTLEMAEMAMGSSFRVMQDWRFQKQMGWHLYWDPDMAIYKASTSKQVKSLVWC